MNNRFEKVWEKLKTNNLLANTCSLCGYECAFFRKGSSLFYDPGCDCVNSRRIEPCSISRLEDILEWNKGTDFLDGKYWINKCTF